MRPIFFLAVAISTVTALLGCAGGNSQLATCQAEKEQLLSTIRGQRESTRALESQVASLESRLDQSEKELARGGSGTRISSRPAESIAPSHVAPPAATTLPVPSKPAPRASDSLPWRAPSGKTDSAAPTGEKTRTSGTGSAAAGASLLFLSRRDRRVQYDAQARAARIDLPIAFSEQSASLTGEDKRQLDELARLLKSDEARELRVMVAGSAAGRPSTTAVKAEGEDRFASSRQLGTARAQAVADYLDRHGIAGERLAISGNGTRGAPAAGNSDQLAASGVQIYLLDPDVPVVGWDPNQAIRR
jgi:outer membrane protein OmpA-like peptidoglycan-associated protein